jgi:hypothetical protein
MSAGPILHPESDDAPSHADRDPNAMGLFNISPFCKELEILLLYLQILSQINCSHTPQPHRTLFFPDGFKFAFAYTYSFAASSLTLSIAH